MARPASLTKEMLALLIRARGPVSAPELAAILRVNRTTVTRLLATWGDELATLGSTRSTRYLLRRGIGNTGNRWPVYRIDPQGQAIGWAELEAFHDRHWRITWNSAPAPEWAAAFTGADGLWSGFPFFLADIRPQGFLGRLISREISPLLFLPEDPREWSDEDVIVYLAMAGADLPGDLVVGDRCLRLALEGNPGATIPTGDRPARYPELAEGIARHLPGSSAGGEHPKFLASTRDSAGTVTPVLVKFSAPLDQPAGRRWADLLRCEYHAHEVLADIGLSRPGTTTLDAGGRRFLEVPRFDRQGAGGRRAVVSLEALHAAAIGSPARSWPEAAKDLQRAGLIDEAAVATAARAHAFGRWIGNTDMHAGNLAFHLDDRLPLRPAPVYDMLPMLWAPGPQGEIIDRPYRPPSPLPAEREAWRETRDAAGYFWRRVADDPLVSHDRRAAAGECLGAMGNQI